MSLFSTYFSTLSVKDPSFAGGAKGDGVTDDTAAIQACFDAAWGSVTAPHGTNTGPGSSDLNKAVFLPNGTYNVVAPADLTISGIADNGAGLMRVTVNSTAGWKSGWIAYISGVTGTIAVFANDFHGITVIDSTHIDLRRPLAGAWSGTYTSGGTVKTAALHAAAVDGGKLFGAGTQATLVKCSNGSCISFNGFGYGSISNMYFQAPGTADVVVDLNWDGVSAQSTQEVTVADCFVEGGKYGLAIGVGGSMCSEVSLWRNFIHSATVGGLVVGNQNAVGMSVFGGNFAQCAIGILVNTGAIEVIKGVHFQGSTTRDIDILSSQGDAISVSGCRSESVNFASFHAGIGASVDACTQISASAGVFAFVEGGSNSANACTINNCWSQTGTITGNGNIALIGTTFAVGMATAVAAFGISNNGRILQIVAPPDTIANLPTPSIYLKGLKMVVIDASAPASTSNFSATVGAGKTITGGGTNLIPVWCDGTDWRVG